VFVALVIQYKMLKAIRITYSECLFVALVIQYKMLKAIRITYSEWVFVVLVTQCKMLKAIRITYSECMFVVLVTQYKIRIRRIILLSVVCLPLLCIFFQRVSLKAWMSDNKIIELKMCVLNSCTNLYETFLILGRTKRDMIKERRFSRKEPLIWAGFNSLNVKLNPICKSQFAELFCGYLNFAHAYRKTWIYREQSGINLWNTKHFVEKETDIKYTWNFCSTYFRKNIDKVLHAYG
jgi:hypothetical protein